MKALAVFISGTGTNLRTIATFCKENPHLAKISVVVSNKADVGGLKIAHSFGLPAVVIKTKGRTMEEFESDVDQHLKGVDFICLAGFMRVLTSNFIQKWEDTIVNIHPSILPAFKGANAIEDALNYGVKITGCTVHYVTPEIDSGKIISQKAVEVTKSETKESLKLKIHKAEKLAYEEALIYITSS